MNGHHLILGELDHDVETVGGGRRSLTRLLANRKGMYPPLVPAARWAKVKRLRQLQA